MKPLVSIHLASMCTASLLACTDERPHVPTTVADSSGVRISISAEVEDTYALVDTQPSLSLGGADGAGPQQFYNIQGLYIDAAGNIWVANRGSNELRIFRPDGSHWKTLGRRGDGPGEFRLIRLLGPVPDNRVALWDDGNPRLTLVTDQGDLESVTPLNAGGTPPRADGTFRDGALLVRFPRVIAAASLAPGALIADTSAVFRYDYTTDSVTELGTVSGYVWIWTGRLQVPVPFTIKAALATDSTGALHVADGPEFRISVLNDRVLQERYGVDRPARPATDTDRAVYRTFHRTHLADREILSAYLTALDHPAVPARLPAYSQLLFDDIGNTWALNYSPDLLAGGLWDVYGPDRQLLGKARTPPGLIVNAIAGNSVVGVWRDELDVEYVRLHRYTIR
jgi:hypothetical protein